MTQLDQEKFQKGNEEKSEGKASSVNYTNQGHTRLKNSEPANSLTISEKLSETKVTAAYKQILLHLIFVLMFCIVCNVH